MIPNSNVTDKDNQFRIVIKKEYFDNIKTAIDSLNVFFSSKFKKKDFPVIDSDFQLDGTILTILSWLNNVEPSWIDDTSKIDETINSILGATEDMSGDIYEKLTVSNNTDILDQINAFIGFKVLQMIADHFEEFSTLVNGIYTFDLFIEPLKYRSIVEQFSQPIDLSEIDKVVDDVVYTIFDITKYVTGIFNNDQIKLPNTMKLDTEIARLNNFTDVTNIDVMIDDETIQESAFASACDIASQITDNDINFHIKYDTKKQKWLISKQFEKAVNYLVAELRKCDTTEDLIELFSSSKFISQGFHSDLTSEAVTPFILLNTFSKENKFKPSNWDKEENMFTAYMKTYKGTIDKNAGAKRFFNYDLFSTFKADKEGTIKFIEDFLKLNLVNEPTVFISNNTLLTIFNIFDSRIYLDIMYYLLSDEDKKKYVNEDSFVKTIRARINSNSRQANVYQKDNSKLSTNKIATSEEFLEYSKDLLIELEDLSIADMMYCESFQNAISAEIRCLNDLLYNTKTSQLLIDKYIGESYDIFQEMEMGDIPDYMKQRINTSDEIGTQPEVSVLDFQLPPDVPMNPIDELATSIDAKLSVGGGLEDSLGAGYMDNPHKNNKEGNVVYNITNNYTNSFNKDSSTHQSTITNDLSSNKHTTNRNVNNKSINDKKSDNVGKGTNNNNNSDGYVDTKDSIMNKDNEQKFSNGKTVQEMFMILESEEPLSSDTDAGTLPKEDLLTTAMDVDRKLLSTQQKVKGKVNKVINTGKAVMKPVTRTKQWLTKIVDSLIKRDEDKVKAEIIENPSYRTAIYKAARLALKCGMTGIAFTINGYLGAAYLAINVAKVADKERLKKEVQSEFTTELEIINDKIEKCDDSTPEGRKAKYQMMRLRSKMQDIALTAPKSKIRHPRSTW